MNQLPQPVLGDVTAFTINTPDLEQSLTCYQQLGFKELYRAEWPFPWIQVSDGVILIMLRKDPTPYFALTYYVKKVEPVVSALEAKGIVFLQKPKPKDAVKRYLAQSPDGLNISIVGMIEGFRQPPGPGMLQMAPEDYLVPEKYVNKTCGLFGELAHPVINLEQSLDFWERLGFKAVSCFDAPYPWAIITDGLSIVGLHQTNRFKYPSITYYAADMAAKVARLKAARFADIRDDGGGNYQLVTPENQPIFLYSMGNPATEKRAKDLNPNIIETARLQLKEITPELMNALFTSYIDEEIMEFMGITERTDLEEQKSHFRQGMTTYRISYRLFLLTEKESGKIIGKCGLHNWYGVHKRAELGYIITDTGVRNSGYMTEAAAAVIRYGFETLDLNRIEAFTGPANIASQKVLAQNGFTREGLLKSHFFKNGMYEDSICYALLRSEYEALQTK